MIRRALFAVLYALSIAAVLLGARRYLQGRAYSLEDLRHYRLFRFLQTLNIESLERMRLIQRIAIEKYRLKRVQGHVTYALLFGGLALFALALAIAAVWIKA